MHVLLLAAALLAPAVAAQVPFPAPPVSPTTIEVEVGPPPGLVRPLGPFVGLPVAVRYTYMELPAPTEPTRIALAVEEVPPSLVATVSPAEVFATAGPQTPPCACQRTVEVASFLLVSAGADAPAMRPVRLAVAAVAAPNGPHEGSEGRGEVEVTPGGLVQIRASTAQPILRLARGASAEPDIRIENHGNGNARVAFRLEAEPPPGIQVALPPPLVVGSRALGGEEAATAKVRVEVGSDALAGTFTVLVEARSVEDPSAEPDATKVAFNVDVPGAPRADGGASPVRGSPGPGALAAGLALLFAAAGLRRDHV